MRGSQAAHGPWNQACSTVRRVQSASQVSAWPWRQQVPDVKIIMGGGCDLCGKILKDEAVNKRESSRNTGAILGKMSWNFSKKRYQNFMVENNL